MPQRFPPNGPRGGGGFVVNSGDAWLHGLFVLGAIVVLVVGAILLARIVVRRPRMAMGPPPWAHPAIAELDLRYARGEVDRGDYLQRRADLLTPGTIAAPPVMPAAEPPIKDKAAS